MRADLPNKAGSKVEIPLELLSQPLSPEQGYKPERLQILWGFLLIFFLIFFLFILEIRPLISPSSF